jgi:carbon storage regulator
MLVLTRKFGESIVIGDSVTVTVIDGKGERVRLGVEAPAEIPVHREEVRKKIEAGLFDSTRG